jgi:hypothetical protein
MIFAPSLGFSNSGAILYLDLLSDKFFSSIYGINDVYFGKIVPSELVSALTRYRNGEYIK